jgi:hypothetical protein
VLRVQRSKTVDAVTSSTDRPLGVDGAAVSAGVVTVSGALGDALYCASKAVTRNV